MKLLQEKMENALKNITINKGRLVSLTLNKSANEALNVSYFVFKKGPKYLKEYAGVPCNIVGGASDRCEIFITWKDYNTIAHTIKISVSQYEQASYDLDQKKIEDQQRDAAKQQSLNPTPKPTPKKR